MAAIFSPATDFSVNSEKKRKYNYSEYQTTINIFIEYSNIYLNTGGKKINIISYLYMYTGRTNPSICYFQ